MSLATLTLNGEIAKNWIKTVNSYIENNGIAESLRNVRMIFDWFENSQIAKAELRSVIHQDYGRCSYFCIQMLTISGNFAYLRGYMIDHDGTKTIKDVIDSSTVDFRNLHEDEEFTSRICETLTEAIRNMVPSIAGDKQLPSHLDEQTSVITSLVSESDWSYLQQILLSTGRSSYLSDSLLDKFDLHPSNQTQTTNKVTIQ